MPIVQVIILAIVQGLAELLPVSSSAHVVVAEKLLGLDPASPQMTLVLVMLHTGTMFAVIAYFWKTWRKTYFATADAFKRALVRIVWATLLTGIIGEAINKVIEKTVFKGAASKDIEQLFGRLDLVAPALAAAGVLILIAGVLEKRRMATFVDHHGDYRDLTTVTMRQAGWIGAVQGLCMPFRGFSRSGATISTGMLTGATKERAERFSFALAVVLTPPVVVREAMRLGEVSVLAFDQDDKKQLAEGRLLLINNQIDQSTSTIQLKAEFPNHDKRLWPGEFVRIRILITTRKDAVTIPAVALQRGPDGFYVWVIKPDNTTEQRPIEALPVDEDLAVAIKGLDVGEHVVVDGQSRLDVGTHVAVRPPKPPAGRQADKT